MLNRNHIKSDATENKIIPMRINFTCETDFTSLAEKVCLTVCFTCHLQLVDGNKRRECAILDMGLVNLHDYILSDAIEKGKLVEVMAECQHAQQNVYLYYQQKRYLQPKIRRFINFYCQE